ncbi:MAG: arsenate reductase (glutaredoxin) [Bacteroidetes bacterium]|nr:arsenate reductase (glutaredoxin) [Bacteroidota bacterium]MCK5765718.1 arsenate reductase (glutaredoxin) [Bacteroidales bacterium]
MIKIYHNPRCKKSRAGLQYLREKGIEPEVIEYLKTPLSEADVKDLLVRLHKKPTEIIRTQEAIYKSDFKGKNFTDDEWVKILLEYPKLIQRPIVVKGPKAVLGDPASEIDVLL